MIENLPHNGVSSQANTETVLKTYQKQILSRLKTVKQSLISEIGDVHSIKNERDIAVVENEKLKEDVKALNYRIQILIKALIEEESKNNK